MRILAVDLGLARTGLAVSDPGGKIATPVGTIAERHMDALLQKVAAAAAEQKAVAVVVGHPRNMDGSAGPRAAAPSPPRGAKATCRASSAASGTA